MPACVICGKPCKKKTCSVECRAVHLNKAKSARRKAARVKARMSKPPLVCTVCKKEFYPTAGHGRVTCGSPECQEEYRRAYDIDRNGRVLREFDCPSCGKHVSTYRKSQTTCGADDCYNRLYRAENGDELRAKRADRGKKKSADCPWENGWFDTYPPEVTTWDCGQMDPMTNRMEAGVWVEMREIKECAA